MKIVKLALFLFVVTMMAACKKGPGEGGMASIQGKLKVRNVSGSGTVLNEYYLPDERVYIIYGDGTVYNDNYRTSYDGSFRFDYLLEGHYTIFAYSYCDTCQSGKEPVFLECDITSYDQLVELSDLVVKKP